MGFKKKVLGILLAAGLIITAMPDSFVMADAAATATTINVDLSGIASGGDITSAVNDALTTAKDNATDDNPYIVKVPAGSWTTSGMLAIYSNTTLDLTDVSIYSDKNRVLVSGDVDFTKTAEAAGYGAYKNIKVVGGSISCPTSLANSIASFVHSKNVTLEGVTFSGGGGGHQVEVMGLDGFTVKNCTFKDFTPVQNEGSSYEALQIDIACNSYIFDGIYYDGTPCKNVSITGCTFDNVPRGLGSHSHLQGAYVDGVTISGNTFKNIPEMAITCVDYINCTISNNTISNCGQGISFFHSRSTAGSCYSTILDGAQAATGSTICNFNSTISNNTIQIYDNSDNKNTSAIRIEGTDWTGTSKTGHDGVTIKSENCYLENVTVKDNTITTAGYGIYLGDVWNSVISGNKITGKDYSSKSDVKYVGIRVSNECKNIDLTNENTITNTKYHGIYVIEKSTVTGISNQKISKTGGSGIQTMDSKTVVGNISNNTITDSDDGGIYINDGSVVGDITGNTIKGAAGKSPISLYKATAGTISDNKLSDLGKQSSKKLVTGIKVGTSSTATAITNNTIPKNYRGIEVYKSSTVTDSITGNKISDSSDKAIYVSNKSTVKKAISGNTIKGCGAAGISIASTSNNLLISKNTVSGTKEHSIMIKGTSNKYTFTIINNKLTGKKKKGNGVHVLSGKYRIGNNTIKSCSRGVYVAIKLTGDVEYNKISKCTKNITNSHEIKLVKSPSIKKAKASGSSIKVTLKGTVDGAAGYVVMVSQDKDFSTLAAKKTIKASAKSAKVSGLEAGTYYVRVASYVKNGKGKFYGKNSKVKQVVIQ